MSERAKCGCCGRSRREEDTTLVRGQSQGNYRRAGRNVWRRVCRECTQDRVDYARAGQAEDRNCPVNESAFHWETAALRFGIDIVGLKLDAWGKRVG